MKTTCNTLVRVFVFAFVIAALAACGTTKVVTRTSSSSAKKITPKVSQSRQGATIHVQKGQTIYRIATENGITPLDLALWNGIAPPYTIDPGQNLRLYPQSATATTSVPKTSTPTAPPKTTTPITSSQPAPPVAATPIDSGFKWRWPTDGQVIGTFANGDATRQGIDIAGNAGQPVLAAADGTVVYSGAGLVGYGELIIIKHNEQWLSAYGHNRTRMVNEGQIVKAGQQIAEMGHSGAARDMLHFEIRFNGKPVNPQDYLPKK
jgi:lipoprotein NlpD